MDLNDFAMRMGGGLGGVLGDLMQAGMPNLITLTLKVENGFIVFSQRLEARQGERFKMPRAILRGPHISGDSWKHPADEGEDPKPESYTYHVVRWAAVFCKGTAEVAAQHDLAAAESAKILAWKTNERRKEQHGHGAGPYLYAPYGGGA